MTEHEQLPEDVIDLGIASVETKGGSIGHLDAVGSLHNPTGLSDD